MMKRSLTIALAVIAAAALFSCKEDSLEPVKPEIPIVFQVDPHSLAFGSEDEDAQTIYVTSMNVTWQAEVGASDQNWLKITVESDNIRVRVEKNFTEVVRTGKITITPENDALNPVVITVTQSTMETLRIPMHLGILAFYGDRYECGNSNYVLTLGGGEAEYNLYDRKIYINNGYAAVFDILTEEIVHRDYQVIDLKPGTYNISMDPQDEQFEYEKWSFRKTVQNTYAGAFTYDGSWIMNFAKWQVTENIMLEGGRMIVEKEGDDYTITAELFSVDGRRIVMDYSGQFIAKWNTVSVSNYTEDTNITEFNRGSLKFSGEKANVPDCYYWILRMQTASDAENRASILIALYSPQTDPLVLDDGEYVITYPYGEFTVEPGWIYSIFRLGTIVYGYDRWGKLAYASPLIEGTITIKHNGENNYTIEIDTFMDNYYKLTASYEGDLENSSSGFAEVPYKMGNNDELPVIKTREKNDRSVFYSLHNID